jgi:tetratricopeptide (TPR) repeat protein
LLLFRAQVEREILQSHPENGQSWRNLIVLFRRQQRMTEAADLCRQARAHCPDDPDLLLLHGMLLQEQGKSTEAEACLLNLAENSFGSGEDRQRNLMARHYLALTYRDRGWLPKAVDQWQNLLADAPYDLAAWTGLAETYLAMGDLEGCQEIARRLSWRPEWIFQSKVLQARGNLAREHFSAARQLLEEVLVDNPSDERCLVLEPSTTSGRQELDCRRTGAAANLTSESEQHRGATQPRGSAEVPGTDSH